METLIALNHVVGFGALLLQIVAGILLAIFLLKETKVSAIVTQFFGRYGMLLTTIFSFGAAVMSLYYSDVIGFIPCSLCWFMRISMFSIAIISLVAFIKKDKHIADYILTLAVIGIIIGLYHHALQMNVVGDLPCPVSGGDCAKRLIFEFGYITFPLVGVSLFAAISMFMLNLKRSLKDVRGV